MTAQEKGSRADFHLPSISAPAKKDPAHLIVAAPFAEALARGLAAIRYRADNLRIVSIYGAAALGVTPGIGHIHVTVDDARWHWVDAGSEPVIIQGLTPGPHHVLIDLADPLHRVIDSKTISFEIPDRSHPAGN